MPELRPKYKKMVFDTLNETYFGISNFEVSFPEDSFLVLISLKSNIQYFLKIDTDNYIRRYPGHLKNEEEWTNHPDFISCLSGIQDWAQSIVDDIKASTAINEIYDPDLAKMKKQFEEQIDKDIKNPNVRFTKAEAQNWQERLDNLSHKFEKLEEENNITKIELSRIKTEIEDMKSNLNSFPKGIWLKTTGTKVLDMLKKFSNSEAGKTVIKETIKGILPGN